MNDFESDLAKTRLRGAPAEWRGEILRAARSAATDDDAPVRESTRQGALASPRGRRWLAPQPLALAAAWLVIAVLRMATPAEPAAAPTADVAQIKAQIRAQQKLLAELLRPEVPAPTPQRRQGATIPRQKHQPA